MLIHICKAIRKNTPEEITRDLYDDIPKALDLYFGAEPHKAIQDKSILAEMIGRYGPRDGWEQAFEALLNDHDENLRQFTLHSLEYSAEIYVESVLPYLERYRKSPDAVMRQIAAHLTGNLLCSPKSDVMKSQMRMWHNSGERHFITEIIRSMERDFHRDEIKKGSMNCLNLINWLKSEFNVISG